MNCKYIVYLMVLLVGFSGLFILMNGDVEVDGYAPESITDMSIDAVLPEAHGDHVVYEVVGGMDYRVYYQNIRTGISTMVVDFESKSPDISGDRIVFKGYLNSQWDLFLYSISSGTWTRLTNDAIEEDGPKIDGNDIVYFARIGFDWEVFHLDAISLNFRRLSTTRADDFGPNIHDGMVVWTSIPTTYSMIMGHDLRTGTTFEVENYTGYNLMSPDVYGDRVVFTFSETSNTSVVYMKNMTLGKTLIVSNYLQLSFYPRIFRENIVFLTYDDDASQIGLFNLERGYEQLLTHDMSDKDLPVIWGEHVYYESLRGYLAISHILLDYDDDGIPDQKDMFPYDHNEHFDFDGDGMGDYKDYDDDNDGFEDPIDAFPRDPDEWYDFDGDGMGDNHDEDDDNDGIIDVEDNNPRDPNTPIIVILHDIMIRLDEVEGHLIERINGLENILSDLAQEDPDSFFDQINNSLVDLETALSNVNFTVSSSLDGILGSINGMRADLEEDDGQGTFPPESFFDVFTDLMVDLTGEIFEHLENLTLKMDQTSQGINDTEEALGALQTLDDIVADLENMGKNIESQNDEIDDNGSNLRSNMIILLIVVSIWSIIILGFVFVRTNSGGDTYVDDD